MNTLPIVNVKAPYTCGQAREAALEALSEAAAEAINTKGEVRKRIYRMEESVRTAFGKFADPPGMTPEALKAHREAEAQEIGVVVRADTLPILLPWVLQNLDLISVLSCGTRAFAAADYIVTVDKKHRADLVRMVEAIEGAEREIEP